ncbi:PREDICTED: uncharacterized protein LOC107170529 [Diuraphis noxia]|uniref:uncharacterized protein LOC107170529 n=1 Tax=Diuraphis noxia TaxID=143948 RepID=UPI00076392EA|nr:PREDICTED: uncharacterized protein LOC107170529 [Diuraphis noxia]
MHKVLVRPIALYACAALWPSTKTEGKKLAIFERKVLRQIFRPKKNEVTNEFERRTNDDLIFELYNQPDIVAWQSTVDKSEGGDGLTLNVETKLKLESVEKLSDELKKKTELLAEQVREIKLCTDKNLMNNDQIIALNAELNKFKNDMENMRNQEAADELGASKLLKNILDKTTVLDSKIVSEMHRLKTMVEDACASKKSSNFAMEQLKEVHRLKMDENEKCNAMLNSKLMVEISQLKEYAIKVEEEAKYKHLSIENYYEDDYSST